MVPSSIKECFGLGMFQTLIGFYGTGNTDESTMGCLILGSSQTENITAKDGFVGASVKAYKRVYPPIAAALEGGEKVTVTYIDYDYVEGKKLVKVPKLEINGNYKC